MDASRPVCGIVGLGRMGSNMARRLKEQGWPIGAVFDRDPVVTDELAGELGCRAARTLAEVTASGEIILTVVSDDLAMLDIFSPGNDRLLVGASGKTFINFATVSPSVHFEVERRAQEAGAFSIEACMASSIPQAREGTLYLILAGNLSVIERVEPLLAILSSSRRYVGPTGRAAQVKALVNMVMNINTAALAEGLGLGEALGLDLTMLREVFAQTGANSRVLQTDGEDMQLRNHDCYFSAAHAAKDSAIAVRLASEAGVSAPLANAAWAQYQTMVEKGLGNLDKSGIAELTFKNRRPANCRIVVNPIVENTQVPSSTSVSSISGLFSRETIANLRELLKLAAYYLRWPIKIMWVLFCVTLIAHLLIVVATVLWIVMRHQHHAS